MKTIMKNLRSAFALLTLLLMMGACTNGDDNSGPSTDVTNGDLTGDGWVVSWFWDKDKEETSDFNGYVFFFRESGAFEALRNGTTTTGSWAIRSSSNGSQRLDIDIASASPLDELIDDWIILEKTNSTIKLRDDNTEHLEELHFTKQ